jgi:hypothetical protein
MLHYGDPILGSKEAVDDPGPRSADHAVLTLARCPAKREPRFGGARHTFIRVSATLGRPPQGPQALSAALAQSLASCSGIVPGSAGMGSSGVGRSGAVLGSWVDIRILFSLAVFGRGYDLNWRRSSPRSRQSHRQALAAGLSGKGPGERGSSLSASSAAMPIFSTTT